jgi:hypothetical protein
MSRQPEGKVLPSLGYTKPTGRTWRRVCARLGDYALANGFILRASQRSNPNVFFNDGCQLHCQFQPATQTSATLSFLLKITKRNKN